VVSKSTVFLIDDDPSILAALQELVGVLGLESRCFGSAAEFLTNYKANGPGCLILDVRMPGMSGLDLQKEMAARGIQLPTIVITGFGDVRMAVEAMKAGAIEFLQKPFRTQELCDHIQKAIKLDDVNWRDRQRREQVRQLLAGLTVAEKEVFEMVVAGKTNRVIADELGLSVRTIEDRRARMMRKIGAKSRAELLELADADGAAPLKGILLQSDQQ
jgi:RNA polymerase sigma factor (sigma-70 family)